MLRRAVGCALLVFALNCYHINETVWGAVFAGLYTAHVMTRWEDC